MVAWGGGAISYERGTPVLSTHAKDRVIACALAELEELKSFELQGYLTHKKQPPP